MKQIRGEEPQSHRDYYLALSKKNDAESCQKAVDILVKILERDWDVRFDQIEVVCMMVFYLLQPNDFGRIW